MEVVFSILINSFVSFLLMYDTIFSIVSVLLPSIYDVLSKKMQEFKRWCRISPIIHNENEVWEVALCH